MSNLLDLPLLLERDGLAAASVVSTSPELMVALPGRGQLSCDVLETASGQLRPSVGDVVLLWAGLAASRGVVLGRVASSPPTHSVAATVDESGRLVIEADGDIVIKNKRAKILLTAEGDIEFVGVNFTTRCQRLLKLLAPLIKLN